MLGCISPKTNTISNHEKYYSLIKSAICSKLSYHNLQTLKIIISNKRAQTTFIEHVTRSIFENINHLRYISSSPESNEDCQLYVWTQNGTAYVTFRGTSSIQDVMADLRICQHNLKNKVKIHAGFFQQYTSIEQELMQYLDSYDMEYDKIHVCGHSLGGALSQLACVFLARRYAHKKICCHTFGSPRVGNKHFVKAFSMSVHQHYRCVNKEDFITMIPPRMKMWSHPNNMCICFDKNGKHTVIKHDRWMYRPFTFKGCICKDHSINTYLERLCNIYLDKKELCTMKME